jgi:hypothetical protein
MKQAKAASTKPGLSSPDLKHRAGMKSTIPLRKRKNAASRFPEAAFYVAATISR